jgi:hypothetical protein
MIRTQIQLTEEQANALKKLSLSRHLSIAELIRQAVDNILKSSTAIDTEERKKRAINAAGRFSSGKRDIAREHDKYLADAFSK